MMQAKLYQLLASLQRERNATTNKYIIELIDAQVSIVKKVIGYI